MYLWLGRCAAVHGGQEVHLSGFIQRARFDWLASSQQHHHDFLLTLLLSWLARSSGLVDGFAFF